MEYMPVLDFPADAAREYASLRAALKRQGTPIGNNDMLVAAHALHLGLTLVTNNVREFSRVPGLKIENWTEAF
jgi:tRNA(fMet)-specific endonuclease VapC